MAKKTKKLNLNYSLCNSDKKGHAKDVSETTYKTVDEAQAAAGKKYRYIVIGTQIEGEPVGQIQEATEPSKVFDLKAEAAAKSMDDLLNNKEAKDEVEKKTKASGSGERKPGVISAIVDILKEGQHTKKEILDKLVVKFPDREPDKMMKTINCQVPNRIRKEKTLNVMQRSGKYWIEE